MKTTQTKFKSNSFKIKKHQIITKGKFKRFTSNKSKVLVKTIKIISNGYTVMNNIFPYRVIKKVHLFAGIEPFHYLCNVKEIMNVELIKKSDEFSVGLIQWLS